jgi:hypothetical protein
MDCETGYSKEKATIGHLDERQYQGARFRSLR